MALNGLFCADVPLKNYSLTQSHDNGDFESARPTDAMTY